MLDFLRSALAIVFVFGVVVFVHELGHFLAAKAVGVYAPRFSIGFGRALWSFKWGETEYILGALPLGGYVRMASREDQAMAMIEGGPETPAHDPGTVGGSGAKVADEEVLTPSKRHKYWDPDAIAPFGPKPVPEHRLFESKSLPARLLIMFAGVTMNVVLALAIFMGLYAAYGVDVTLIRTIAEVRATPAAPELPAKILPGDTILAVNGRETRSWDDIQLALRRGVGDSVRFRTNRGQVAVAVVGAEETRGAALGRALVPLVAPVVDYVLEGPAKAAGVQDGDSIVAADGRPVRTWSEVVRVIEASAGRTIQFEVVRKGERRTLSVRPMAQRVVDPVTGETRSVGKIGAAPRTPTARQPVAFGEAVALGWSRTWFGVGQVVGMLKDLLIGRASPRELGGIIEIASQSKQAARQGLDSLLALLAIISVNLAVFNLLPIPILDGGQIVLNVAEAARGRAFSDRTRQIIAYVGLSAIALLVVFALFNDLSRRVNL